MRTLLLVMVFVTSLSSCLFGQNINNTLGSGGSFTVKDGSTTFLSLNQSNGHVSLSRNLILPITTGDNLGVIFKGGGRFLHDFVAAGTAGQNTFLGYSAGNFTMSGTINNEASYNTAVGFTALTSLSSGHGNSAFGNGSLYSNTSGHTNCAYGASSLFSNTTGAQNSAFGNSSLYYNTADGNSAFGLSSLYNNTTGYANSAFGYEALKTNTTGRYNSAFGHSAFYSATGDSNTAVGYYAGSNLQAGSNNILIGFYAQGSGINVSNQVTLGNANITSLRCAVTTITALSDARDKKNIRDLPLGLDFLLTVKPRLFNWNRREWYEGGTSDGSKMKQEPTAGFIAQELDEAQTKANAEWLNLVLKSNPDRLEATPGNLLPIMVKAIQELKQENDELRNELAAIRSLIKGAETTARVSMNEEK